MSLILHSGVQHCSQMVADLFFEVNSTVSAFKTEIRNEINVNRRWRHHSLSSS